MSKHHSRALQSLTATYTDSEGEGSHSDEDDGDGEMHSSVSGGSPRVQNSQPPSARNNLSENDTNTPTKGGSKVARLVSYQDDMVISDDEKDETLRAGDTEEELLKSHSASSATNSPAVLESATSGQQNRFYLEDPCTLTPDVIKKRLNDLLPPEPTGNCSKELQEKISRYYERVRSGSYDMNRSIQDRKDFRNPSIYEKLIQFCGINEFGTNYPREIFDPGLWGPESYYEELAKAQKEEMERREKEKKEKEKAKVEIKSGTAKTSTQTSSSGKSKWDQAGILPSIGPYSIPPPGYPIPPGQFNRPPPPLLTNVPSGTKGTVISAFGSLPKKG